MSIRRFHFNLLVMLLSLVSFLAVGCGSSNNDWYGSNDWDLDPYEPQGSVTFSITPGSITLPDPSRIFIEILDDHNTVIGSQAFDLGSTYTINNLDIIKADHFVATVYNSSGVPIHEFDGNLNLRNVSGSNVQLSGGTVIQLVDISPPSSLNPIDATGAAVDDTFPAQLPTTDDFILTYSNGESGTAASYGYTIEYSGPQSAGGSGSASFSSPAANGIVTVTVTKANAGDSDYATFYLGFFDSNGDDAGSVSGIRITINQ